MKMRGSKPKTSNHWTEQTEDGQKETANRSEMLQKHKENATKANQRQSAATEGKISLCFPSK